MADSDVMKDKRQDTAGSEDVSGNAEDILLPVNGPDEEDEKSDEFEDDENMGVPTDEGYSWVIVTCVVLSAIITVGHNRSLSALFVDVSEEFAASTTVTSLTFTFYTATIGLSNLITSNILFSRITVRTICVVAGFFNAATTVAISAAPNITTWLCLYAVKGIFFGALMVPPMAMIGYYFKRRRSLASAIASTGVVVAYIAFPPFATFLRLEFGLRGTLLIIGALELHEIAIGMLIRPIKPYKQAYLRKRGTALKNMPAVSRANTQTDQQQPSQPTEGPADQEPLLDRQINDMPDKSEVAENELSTSQENGGKSFITNDKRPRSVSFELANGPETHLKRDVSARRKDDFKLAPLSKSSSQFSVKSGGASLSGSMLDVVPVDVEVPRSRDDSHGSRSFENNAALKDKSKTSSVSCTLSTFVDTTLLKLWTFRMTLGYMALSSFMNFIIMYMPTIAYQAGIDKTDAALLLTVSGCMDLVVRVFVGFIADKNIISKENLVIISLAVIVVLTQFARYYTTYSMFVMFALLTGIFSGFRQNLLNPLMLDYFGAERTPKAMGIVATVITLLLAINHPVLGALADATGSFTASLHYVGAFIFLSIFILLSHPICKRWDRENKKKKEQEEAGKGEKMDSADKP